MGVWSKADLEALYTRLEKPLYNVVYRLVWDREEARDLAQEAFVRLWAMRSRIEPRTVEALVYRIALNLARSWGRRRRLRRWLSVDGLAGLPADPRTPETDAVAGSEQSRLRRAIAELPDDVRGVVLLSEFAGLRYEQIAQALGIPEGTVGSRRNRALRLLRRRMAEEGHERTS